MSDETKPKCAFCGAPLKRGEHRVCRRCAAGVAASMTPVATCDGCGRPIHWGNLPNGIPNGVTLKDCGGVPGNDITLCAECLIMAGMAEGAARRRAGGGGAGRAQLGHQIWRGGDCGHRGGGADDGVCLAIYPGTSGRTTNQQTKGAKTMHTAAKEWADRVAARNEIETEKAFAEAQMVQGFLPFTYGEQPVALGAEAAGEQRQAYDSKERDA